MDPQVSTPVPNETRVPTFATPHVTFHCGNCGGISPYRRDQGCTYCHPACKRWHVPLWLVRLGQRLHVPCPF